MFEKYHKVSISFNELSSLKSVTNEPFLLEVNNNGVKYEFFIRVKKKSKKILVFGSGAYKPSTMTLPVFQRHSWYEEFDESIIYYNDPTLYLDRLMLGWGFGDLESHYLKKIGEIINTLRENLEYESEETYFYGSSAGGFMSLMLSSMIKGSTAIVNNPQTILTNYQPVHVNKLMKILDITKEIAERDYEDRINVVSSFKKYHYIPRIYYLQNAVVEHDVDNHLNPFIAQLKSIDENVLANKLHIDLYFDYKLGHNPIGKNPTITYIKDVLYS